MRLDLKNVQIRLLAAYISVTALVGSVSAASIPIDGVTVLCTKGPSGLYRYAGQQLRRYPNPPTAKYYDPNFATNFVEMDCTGKLH
jgi:hypothetical protein